MAKTTRGKVITSQEASSSGDDESDDESYMTLPLSLSRDISKCKAYRKKKKKKRRNIPAGLLINKLAVVL